MKLKNDPYFPVVALAMIAALVLSLLSPTSVSADHAATPNHLTNSTTPANTLTASSAAVTPAE